MTSFKEDTAVFYSHKLEPVPQHDHDFLWSLKEEPHFSRRKAILKQYPQVQQPPISHDVIPIMLDPEAVWPRAAHQVGHSRYCCRSAPLRLRVSPLAQLYFPALLAGCLRHWYSYLHQ